jgi:hypothetical protein
MKNILSSLNESEKRRILEMHYRASNRQYLTEGVKDVIITSAELSALGASSVEVLVDNAVGPDIIVFKMAQEKLNPGTNQGVATPSVYCRRAASTGQETFRGATTQTKAYPSLDVNKLKELGLKQCDHSQAEFNKSKGIVTNNQTGGQTKPVANTTTPGKEQQQPTESLTKGMIDYTTSVINDLLSAFSATSINVSGDIGNKFIFSVTFQMKVDLNKDGSQPTYACTARPTEEIAANSLRYYQKYFKYNSDPYKLMMAAGAKQCKASGLKIKGK